MLSRTFGEPTKALSLLGFGASRVGSFNNPTPLPVIRETMARALDLGVTLFDTADIYGQGDSEREIGRLFKGRRDRGFVVSKGGKTFSAKMRLLRPLKPILKPLLAARGGQGDAVTARRSGEMNEDFSIAHIVAAVDQSLRRLGFERLDGFLLHSPPAAAITPSLADALARLAQSGKVAHYGVSCDDLACLEASLDVPGLSLLELPVDMIETIGDGPLGAAIRDRRIGLIAREAISLRPDLAPADAVARAAASPLVTSVVVGTSKTAHLEALARALSV